MNIIIPNTPTHDAAWGIAAAGEGRLWLGTMNGLDLFDPATGQFTHYRHDLADPTSLGSDQIVSLHQQEDGTLWVSTNHGLSKIDPRRGTFHNYDASDGHFHPLQTYTQHRWLSIAIAHKQGRPLPPVELINVGNIYFVCDGHHRISVAQMMGQEHIDAEVAVWDIADSTPCCKLVPCCESVCI